MTFKQEFILMLADKLIIGAIIGLIVYLAHKRLERFKAEQSLEGEIAKQRIDNIAKGWQVLNQWDLTVSDVIFEFARLVRKQKPQLQPDAGLDELGQPDLKVIAANPQPESDSREPATRNPQPQPQPESDSREPATRNPQPQPRNPQPQPEPATRNPQPQPRNPQPQPPQPGVRPSILRFVRQQGR